MKVIAVLVLLSAAIVFGTVPSPLSPLSGFFAALAVACTLLAVLILVLDEVPR